MKKTQNAEEMKLKANFDTLRSLLLEERFVSRHDYLLAFWTLPEDRRLPLSLLNFPLSKILRSSFEELASTAGIGQKKLHSLIHLMQRAAGDSPPSKPITLSTTVDPIIDEAPPATDTVFRPVDASGNFDSSLVSEGLWQEWRETVEAHNLGELRLGRLAPSLQELPTVIWHAPLRMYASQTLTEIRHLRTHGEKRVRSILEIFYIVHEMMQGAGRHARLALRVEPRFIQGVEQWFHEMFQRESLPARSEINEHLVMPLIHQLTVDAGADVVHLARGRLGVDGEPITVRQQSRDMRVTRARVYQLLEECDRIMEVRWPTGRLYFQEMAERFNADRRESMASELFFQTYDLFYPRKYARVETVLTEVE